MDFLIIVVSTLVLLFLCMMAYFKLTNKFERGKTEITSEIVYKYIENAQELTVLKINYDEIEEEKVQFFEKNRPSFIER